MIRRRLAIAAVLALVATSAAAAQETTTNAERTYREVRDSTDVKTKLMAERWYSAIKLQEWGDASGKFKTTAKYVEHDPNLTWVKLRVIRGTGDKRVVKDVTIPLEKLSKVCQARVRQIGVLSEKVAAAIEAEKDKETKDADGEPRTGEMPEDRLSGEDPRSGRGEYDAGLAGMNGEQVLAEGEQAEGQQGAPSTLARPISVPNDGPPLPALLPPLPSDRLRPNVPAPASDAPNPEDAPAEGTPPYERR